MAIDTGANWAGAVICTIFDATFLVWFVWPLFLLCCDKIISNGPPFTKEQKRRCRIHYSLSCILLVILIVTDIIMWMLLTGAIGFDNDKINNAIFWIIAILPSVVIHFSYCYSCHLYSQVIDMELG